MIMFFTSSAQLYQLLIATGPLMPVPLFAGAAWKSRIDVLREGKATVLNAVTGLGGSLRDQLQTEELALADVADRLRGLVIAGPPEGAPGQFRPGSPAGQPTPLLRKAEQ